MTYRDAHTILNDDNGRITKAADAMVDALGLPRDGTEFEQAKVLAASLILFHERNNLTPDAWKAIGYLGNVLYLHGKADRLRANVWDNTTDGRGVEKPMDNAADLINYSVFFIRCALAGNERGTDWRHGER